MSQITRGSSTMMARPIASVLRAMPGPEVVVMASAPEYAAPIAEVIAAISSFCLELITPKFLLHGKFMEDVGSGRDRIGPRNKGRPPFATAATKPMARA